MACKQYLTLNNGLTLPVLGLGTFRAPERQIAKSLDCALEAGYRHIDCAPVYFNEKAIGRVLRKWMDSNRIRREDLFIVTKLPPQGNRASSVESYLRQSLADLQLTYVDMYLLHTPFAVLETNGHFARDGNGDIVLDPNNDLIGTWKKMEEMVSLGLTKSIGISNFNKEQIQRLLANSIIKPANLQIEIHIYLQQDELVKLCKDNNIAVTAYAPLGSSGIQSFNYSRRADNYIPDPMDHPKVIEIAQQHNKTPAQILLRWIIDRGLAAIPKSINPDRLKQNIDLFTFSLSDSNMIELSRLNENIRVCDFGAFKGSTAHPDFPW